MNITNEVILEQLIAGVALEPAIMRELFERILTKAMPDAQIAAMLALLRTQKTKAMQMQEAAQVVLSRATPIAKPAYVYADIVGTGGDGFHTINASTLASLTAASLGLPIAKHGSVGFSSRCGSADLLRELGIDISVPPKSARSSLDEHGWCFLFAPNYHESFKGTKPLRQELKIRTLFNILGPLVNPLRPQVMMIGVYDRDLLVPFAEVLKNLGCKKALVVFGSGLDEIALHGPTYAALVHDASIELITITVGDLGLASHSIDAIKGGDAKDNADLSLKLLMGSGDEAKTSLIAANCGALLWVAEKAPSLKEGVRMASQALAQGLPAKKLADIRSSYGTC